MLRDRDDPQRVVAELQRGPAPALLASITTVLGMIPLFSDAFFNSMAVTIPFGLLFGTVLTMVVVPVLYAIFFRVPYS